MRDGYVVWLRSNSCYFLVLPILCELNLCLYLAWAQNLMFVVYVLHDYYLQGCHIKVFLGL